MSARLKNVILGLFFVFAIASPVMAVTVPQAVAAAGPVCVDRTFLGIPPWYRGLTYVNNDNKPPTCDLISPSDPTIGGIGKYIWIIVLNVIEMAIVAAAYLSAFFIIYGGFLFMTGGSNPSQTEKARKTILNALIGLVIAMSAVALTRLVFDIIT